MIRKKITSAVTIEKRKCRIPRDLYFHFHASRESFSPISKECLLTIVESRVNLFSLFFLTLQNVMNK